MTQFSLRELQNDDDLDATQLLKLHAQPWAYLEKK